MAKQIRLLFNESNEQLNGIVEIDETHVGGRDRNRGRNVKKKTAVVGIVERRGKVIANVVKDVQKDEVFPFILENVSPEAHVMTDDYMLYHSLPDYGYDHGIINHTKEDYVRGNVYTQNIVGF